MVTGADVPHVGSDGLHDTRSFVAENERSIDRPLAGDDVQVGVAHAACAQPYTHEVSPDLDEIQFLGVQRLAGTDKDLGTDGRILI